MANLYWYPDATSNTGTGNWSATGATGHWATAPDGTGLGHAAPTSGDNVFFGTTSFNGAGQVVTVDATANCKDLSFVGATNTPTLARSASANINIYGSLTLISAMTVTYDYRFAFSATSGSFDISCPLTLPTSLEFNIGILGGSATFNLQSNIGAGTSGSFFHTAGILNTNGYAITYKYFIMSGSSVKTLTLGSSIISITDFNYSGSNLTLTANTSTINCSGNFSGGGLTTYNIVNLTGATSTITGNNTFATLSFINPSAAQTITLPASGTQTVTGTFTATGQTTSNRCTIQSSSAGTSSTINAATVAVTKSDLKDLIGAGAGSWDMGASSDVRHVSGGSNISYNAFWSADTGNWSDYGNKWATLSGGTTRLLAAPDSVTNVYFDALSFTAGSKTVTVDATANCLSMDWTGATNSPSLAFGTHQIVCYGNGTFISAMTTTGGVGLDQGYQQRASGTLTTNGLSFSGRVTAYGCTLTLGSNLTCYVCTSYSNGVWTTNNYNITANGGQWWITDNTVHTFNFGSSTVNVAGWYLVQGSISINGTYTLNINGDAVHFDGGSTTYNNVYFTGSPATITGNNTMNTLGLMRAGVQTITATGTTQNFKSLIRNAGNQVKTLVNGTYTRLPGGGVNLDYMSISGSTATTALYAGPLTHSTDGGGNTGWVFQYNPERRISRMRRYLAAGVV